MFIVRDIRDVSIIKIQTKKLEMLQCLMLYKIIQKLTEKKNRNIVLDLECLQAINNLFIEKLLKSHKLCESQNCSLSLCGLKHNVLCIFYLLKLDKYFEFYENKKEAFLRENRLVKRKLKIV